MRPLSSLTAKPMLPVGDRPIAAHVADAAVEAGTDELVFVVGAHATHVRSYFGEFYRGVPVRYARQEHPRGVADAVAAASERLDGPFAVLAGDALLDPESVAAVFEAAPAVLAARVDDPTGWPVLSTTDGRVVGVGTQPTGARRELVAAGAAAFPAGGTRWLDAPRAGRDERDLTAVLARAAEATTVQYVESDSPLRVADPDDLARANRRLLAGQERAIWGRVHDDATVAGSVVVAPEAAVASGVALEGPVLVADGATVREDATVRGPTVVGSDAVVGAGAVVTDSVLLPGARVDDGVQLRDVVVSPGCAAGPGAALAGHQRRDPDGVAAVVAPEGVGSEGLPY